MSTFVGGALKLKGGPAKGGVKKKKKKSKVEDGAGGELVLASGSGEGSEQQKQKVTADGVVLDPAADAPADRRTDAEKRAEAHMLKYEEARAKKAAAKSHQQRIKELNEKLASMTEHNDLFRISYTA